MKTSVICLQAKADTGARHRGGFTLLELLVVLALMATMTALVLPRFAALFEAGQRSFERAKVIDALAALPYRAYTEQRGFDLVKWPGQQQSVPLTLPEGWRLEAAGEQGVRYRSNGFCSGGTVRLDTGADVEEFLLEAPLCEPRPR